MRIGVLGLNHRSASLAVREHFARAIEALECETHSIVCLSTCNRSEVYFSSNDPSELHEILLGQMRGSLSFEFEQYLYTFFGKDCFHHLARVVTGLDSAQVGECDIQRQVRNAYENGKEHRILSSELHFVFQKCFKIAKHIRTTYATEQWSVDLPHVIKSLLSNYEAKRLLFVGFSDINRRIMKRLGKNYEIELVTSAEDVPYPKVSHPVWDSYEVVVFGTKSPGYILEGALTSLPKVMLDLSVPRNVDPSLCLASDLYNIDQLQAKCRQQQKRVATAIQQCEEEIASLIERQRTLYYQREVV